MSSPRSAAQQVVALLRVERVVPAGADQRVGREAAEELVAREARQLVAAGADIEVHRRQVQVVLAVAVQVSSDSRSTPVSSSLASRLPLASTSAR
jgi:hypothetical protein